MPIFSIFLLLLFAGPSLCAMQPEDVSPKLAPAGANYNSDKKRKEREGSMVPPIVSGKTAVTILLITGAEYTIPINSIINFDPQLVASINWAADINEPIKKEKK